MHAKHVSPASVDVGRSLLALTLCLVGTVVAGEALAQNLHPGWCYKATLSENPVWVTSGVPAIGESSASLVVDAGANRVLKVTPEGWLANMAIDARIRNPRQIRPDRDGYLLHHLKDRRIPEIYRLSANLDVRGQIEMPDSVVAVYDFAAMGRGVLVFGDLNSSAHVGSALFHVGPDGLEIFRKFRYLNEDGTPNNEVYTYTSDNTKPFLASFGGPEGFMLFRGEPSRIGRVEIGVEGVDYLAAIPEGLHFPQIDWREAESAPAPAPAAVVTFMKAVERSRTATMIFAGREDDVPYLYLVARSARDSARGSSFEILKLHPSTGTEVARLAVPTRRSTAHLTIIPNPSGHWTFIEKEGVVGIRSGLDLGPYTKTESITMMPANWLGKSGTSDEELFAKRLPTCANLALR